MGKDESKREWEAPAEETGREVIVREEMDDRVRDDPGRGGRAGGGECQDEPSPCCLPLGRSGEPRRPDLWRLSRPAGPDPAAGRPALGGGSFLRPRGCMSRKERKLRTNKFYS